MKIPIEWLKQYIITDKSSKELAAAFTQLGLLLDKPVDSAEVLDLEHRMDRADWLSILGCARDLAAFEGLDLNYPEIYAQEAPEPKQKIDIRVEDKAFVNRFYTHIFEGITVTESPEWLKNRLEAYWMPSINNIVDITNYVMIEYGQPMHAHDIDKMERHEIVFRKAKKGEKIQTLLGQEIKLDAETYVTTNNDKPTGIGGIVGGTLLAIDRHTKNIVLDAGNYNQTIIRKTSRRLKIQNETVMRTDKFLHPASAELAIRRAAKLILEIAGGQVYKNIDYYPETTPIKKMEIRYERLLQVGGMEIARDRVKDILQRLEYKILEESDQKLKVEVPFFRTDVEVEDDLVADVLRINDYSKIPVIILQMAPPKEITPKIYDFEEKLRDILAGLGLHEHITDPLIESDKNNQEQIKLLNALTSEESALRTNIFQTLVPVLNTYKKHRKSEIGIFEIGKEYRVSKPNTYEEARTLGVIYENDDLSAYQTVLKTKRILAALLRNVGVENYSMQKNSDIVSISVNGIKVGELGYGKIKVFTDTLMQFEKVPQRVVSQVTSYTVENLSLVVDINTAFGPVFDHIKSFDPQIADVEVIEEYAGQGLEKNKKTILIKITYTISETQKIRNSLLQSLKENYAVQHRQ